MEPANPPRLLPASESRGKTARCPPEDFIRAEQVRMLYQVAPAGFIATVAASTGTVYGLWEEVSSALLVSWLGWVLIVTAGRYALFKAYLRRSPPPREARRWKTLFAGGCGLIGLAWGALATVLFPSWSIIHQMLVIFVIGGMATAATSALASSRTAFLAFLVPSLAPLIGQLFMQGGEIYFAMALMAFVFAAVLSRIHQRSHQHTLATIRSGVENKALLDSLRQARDEAQRYSQKVAAALSEQLLILDTITVGVAFVKDRVIRRNNTRLEQIFGYEAGEMIGLPTWAYFQSEEEWRAVGKEFYSAFARGAIVDREHILLKKDGTLFWCHHTGRAVDPLDLSKGVIWVYQDISDRKQVEQALKESEEHYRYLVETSNDLIWSVDREGRWSYLNPNAVWRIYGYKPEEMLGRPFTDFQSPEQAKHDMAAFQRILAGESVYQFETTHLKKDGTPVVLSFNATPLRDAHGNIIGTTGTAADITERKQGEVRIWHIAHHDALTNLPNRRLFQDRLDQALIRARRQGQKVGLMLLDLDRFKPINDTHGHEIGDIVLQNVAERLRLCVRQSDTVSRQGGDEFAIILPELSRPADAATVAEKILKSVSQPMRIRGNEFHIGASIGICLFPDNAADSETLLKNADIAMYRAKQMGRNNYQFFAG